ncbi:hypothetical protein ONR75_23570 [Rhodopseudomonas sp. P2A-2r]|uniref:hypothetical protein n=1 Tax=Rhodopseudomonas sp. P2A-2r TaxID=2991972 RepID=UPI0022345BD1|nr:hypothetical protein [Rhodopseudomonas sp. P2A-2r]UZE47829.1 hypothetical protein ONR75_23570 [Rhodopseudomonas sp. P2A-2r]
MNELEKAEAVLEALKAAEQELPQAALPILNGIAGLIKGDGDDALEIQEARTDAFMAICELGKALHRGQPADQLWAPAFSAAQRWRGLV